MFWGVKMLSDRSWISQFSRRRALTSGAAQLLSGAWWDREQR